MQEKEALRVLKKYATDAKQYRIVLKHSQTVKKYAVWLATRIKKKYKVDIETVKIGSLLHDIGRFKYPPWKQSIKHGIAGAQIIRKEKLPEKYARICERHLGAGITKADVKNHKLSLPVKDYVPLTIEEKIISYADKRVEQDHLVPITNIINRFSEELGPKYGKRIKQLHKQIQKLYKLMKKA